MTVFQLSQVSPRCFWGGSVSGSVVDLTRVDHRFCSDSCVLEEEQILSWNGSVLGATLSQLGMWKMINKLK